MDFMSRAKKVMAVRDDPKYKGFNEGQMHITPNAFEKSFLFPETYDALTSMKEPSREIIKDDELYDAVLKEYRSFGKSRSDRPGIEIYGYMSRRKKEDFISDIHLGPDQRDNTYTFTQIRKEAVVKAGEMLAAQGRLVAGWTHRHPISQASSTDDANDETICGSIAEHNFRRVYTDKRYDELETRIEGTSIIAVDKFFQDRFVIDLAGMAGVLDLDKLSKVPDDKVKSILKQINFNKYVDFAFGYSHIIIGPRKHYTQVYYRPIGADSGSLVQRNLVDIKLAEGDDISIDKEAIAAEVLNCVHFSHKTTLGQLLSNINEGYDIEKVQSLLTEDSKNRFKKADSAIKPIFKMPRIFVKDDIPTTEKQAETAIPRTDDKAKEMTAENTERDYQSIDKSARPYVEIPKRIEDFIVSFNELKGHLEGKKEAPYYVIEQALPILQSALDEAVDVQYLMEARQKKLDYNKENRTVQISEYIHFLPDFDKIRWDIDRIATDKLKTRKSFPQAIKDLEELLEDVSRVQRYTNRNSMDVFFFKLKKWLMPGRKNG